MDLDLALTDAQFSVLTSLNIVELLRVHEYLSHHLGLLKGSIPDPFSDSDVDLQGVFGSLLAVSQAFDDFVRRGYLPTTHSAVSLTNVDLLGPERLRIRDLLCWTRRSC